MKILRLTWSDFKSFQGEHTLNFRQHSPGLYFIRGENLVEPELGSNGAAKSSIFDVMHWCLFGTSMRGTHSHQLVPWSKSGKPKASMDLLLNGRITIHRSYKPTNLILQRGQNKTPITQDQLEDLLGLTSSTFQNSIVIGQFSRLFFDLRPAEKMSVFSELLDLDHWLVCSDRARATHSTLLEDSNLAQRKLDRTEVRIEEVKGSIPTLRKLQAESSEEQKKASKLAQQKLQGLKSELANVMEGSRKLKRQVKAAQARELFLADRQNELKRVLGEATSEAGHINQKRANLKAELKMQEKQGDLLTKSADTCPTCGQKITKEHRDYELKRLTDRTDRIWEDLQAVELQKQEIDAAIADGVIALENNQLEMKRLMVSELERSLDKSMHEADSISREIEYCNKTLRAFKDQKYKYDAQIKQQKERISNLEQEREADKQDLKLVLSAVEQTKFWVQGFKNVRLFEIGEALTALEVEINSYLSDIGMAGWSVQLLVERTTKSGSISRNFQVIVEPESGGTGQKPWEAWSGGEGQRLRLAGTLALANLILRRHNRNCNLQVFDEQMIFLSGTGSDDVLTLLRETALREGKQIWIIDQSHLNYGFDGVITVVKDHSGSHLVS